LGIFSKRDRSIHSCTVHRTRLHLSEGNSRHLSRRSLSAVAVQRESQTRHVGTKQQRPSRLGSKFRGRMQHRLDIAYDDYLYETSWSPRVSRPVLLLAATSGFNEVIEFGSFCRSLPACCLATNTSFSDRFRGCVFTQRWTILTCSSRQAAIRQS
jgi:hypothetical protein